jgi:energy-coupling factor transport system permease protein
MSRALSDIAIGSYMPGESALHCMDPRVKLFGLVLVMTTVFWRQAISGVLIATALVAAIANLSGIGWKVWLGSLTRFKWMLAMVAVINLFFRSSGAGIIVGGQEFPVTYGGLKDSLLMTIQLADAVVLSMALTFTTTPVDLAKGLQRLASPLKRLRVPVDDFGIVLFLAIRFVPLFQRELSNTIEAQKARGVDFGGRGLISRASVLVAVLGPALTETVRRSELVAVAMSARGFRPGSARTEFRPLVFKKIDWVACVSLVCWTICYLRLL